MVRAWRHLEIADRERHVQPLDLSIEQLKGKAHARALEELASPGFALGVGSGYGAVEGRAGLRQGQLALGGARRLRVRPLRHDVVLRQRVQRALDEPSGHAEALHLPPVPVTAHVHRDAGDRGGDIAGGRDLRRAGRNVRGRALPAGE